jgi:hypothetical protein
MPATWARGGAAAAFTPPSAGRRPRPGTDWAYYDFDKPTKATAAAFRDATCYDCHLKHADVDNVWVQFYPTLRDRGERR